MGYSITIGEAEIDYYYEKDDRGYARISAKGVHHDQAPAFGDLSDFNNGRHPSYSAWADFLKETGLSSIFFDEDKRTLGGHPGAIPIGKTEANLVRESLESWRANHSKEPGFDKTSIFSLDGSQSPTEVPDEIQKDATLARLIWLDYWVDWAVNNCKYPTICNT